MCLLNQGHPQQPDGQGFPIIKTNQCWEDHNYQRPGWRKTIKLTNPGTDTLRENKAPMWLLLWRLQASHITSVGLLSYISFFHITVKCGGCILKALYHQALLAIHVRVVRIQAKIENIAHCMYFFNMPNYSTCGTTCPYFKTLTYKILRSVKTRRTYPTKLRACKTSSIPQLLDIKIIHVFVE